MELELVRRATESGSLDRRRRFTEPPGLHDIAAAVHASAFHLARVFRAWTGASLHAYRNQLRLRAGLEGLGDQRRQVGGLARPWPSSSVTEASVMPVR